MADYPNSSEKRVRAALERNGVTTTTPIYVACSGGLDSTVAAERIASSNWNVRGLLHVDHGTRDALAHRRDREVVEKTGQRLGVPVISRSIAAGAIVEEATVSGESVEAVARRRRYRIFAELIGDSDAVVVTGHHGDDDAETVLMRLVSGRSMYESPAMKERSTLFGVTVVRPFLSWSREELHAYACAHELEWSEDRTNDDTRYLRNYLRHEILPRLSQRFPGVAESVRRAGYEIEQLRLAVEETVGEHRWGTFADDGSWRIETTLFAELSPIQREFVLRAAIKRVSGSDRVSFRPFASLTERDPVDAPPIDSADLSFRVLGDTLTLQRRIVRSLESGYLLEVSDGSCVVISVGGVRVVPRTGVADSSRRSWGPVTPPLVARDYRPGDAVFRRGRPRRWKELFAASRTQRLERPRCVIEDRDGIVAIVRSADAYALRETVDERRDSPGRAAVCVQIND